jgi:hypothetical protein
MIMTPLYESEGELYSLFDHLMRYDENLGGTGEISVYSYMRICNFRTPVGLDEYKYNVVLSPAFVKCRTTEDKEYWWARFYILQRRTTWDITPHKLNGSIYET